MSLFDTLISWWSCASSERLREKVGEEYLETIPSGVILRETLSASQARGGVAEGAGETAS